MERLDQMFAEYWRVPLTVLWVGGIASGFASMEDNAPKWTLVYGCMSFAVIPIAAIFEILS